MHYRKLCALWSLHILFWLFHIQKIINRLVWDYIGDSVTLISNKISCHNVSYSLEPARLGYYTIVLQLNMATVWAALLLRNLPNFIMIGHTEHPSQVLETLWDHDTSHWMSIKLILSDLFHKGYTCIMNSPNYVKKSSNAILLSHTPSDLILRWHPANERRRYKVTPSLIGWAQT